MRIITLACLSVLIAISFLGLFAGIQHYFDGKIIHADIIHNMKTAHYNGTGYTLTYATYIGNDQMQLIDTEAKFLLLHQKVVITTKAVSQRFFWPLAGSAVGLILSISLVLRMWIPSKTAIEICETSNIPRGLNERPD